MTERPTSKEELIARGTPPTEAARRAWLELVYLTRDDWQQACAGATSADPRRVGGDNCRHTAANCSRYRRGLRLV